MKKNDHNAYNYTKVWWSSLIAIYIKYSQIVYHSEKNNGNKNNKNILNKDGEICRDVKTQKSCEQGWEVNVGPKIKQTTPYKPA